MIVPTHNVQNYIVEFVESINRQTLQPDKFEVIFVDDCSSDNTIELVRSTIKDHISHKIIELKRHRGAPGGPRNIGIENSSFDYIVFYDPDDIIPLYAIKTKLETIDSLDSEMLSGRYLKVVSSQKKTRKWLSAVMDTPEEINTHPKLSHHGVDSAPAIWSRIFSKKFLDEEKIRFQEGIYTQDASFMFDVYRKAKKISFVPIVFMYYRERGDKKNPSITDSFSPKYLRDFLFTREYMIEKDPDLYRKSSRRDVKFLTRMLTQKKLDYRDFKNIVTEISLFFLKSEDIIEIPKDLYVRLVSNLIKRRQFLILFALCVGTRLLKRDSLNKILRNMPARSIQEKQPIT